MQEPLLLLPHRPPSQIYFVLSAVVVVSRWGGEGENVWVYQFYHYYSWKLERNGRSAN